MIQDARYTSPNGNEATFEWEQGKRKTELKTGVFTFPGRDGAHVQHQGAGARTFPLVCIFSGDDCMERADAFEAMLIETGVGELQHPTYGTVKVVPTGDIEREDDPVNKYGESTVTITFTETIVDEESGELTEVAAQDIANGLDSFTEAAVNDFANGIITDDITTQADIVSALGKTTQSVIDNLQPIAMADKKKYADWLAAANELKDNIKKLYPKGIVAKIDDIYNKAALIAQLELYLMKLPSTLAVSLSEKIKNYANLTANLINQFKNDPFGIDKIKAAYATACLAITGACASIASGAALSTAESAAKSGTSSAAGAASSGGSKSNPKSGAAATGAGKTSGAETSNTANAASSAAVNKGAGTASREEAVSVASQVSTFLETVTEFQDEKIALDAFVDAMPASHIALTELVYASVQLILNASFALPMQRTITLDRDRQVVELCAELYGTTDCLDDFIIENNFNIDEIVLLPMGKKVSYYVKGA